MLRAVSVEQQRMETDTFNATHVLQDVSAEQQRMERRLMMQALPEYLPPLGNETVKNSNGGRATGTGGGGDNSGAEQERPASSGEVGAAAWNAAVGRAGSSSDGTSSSQVPGSHAGALKEAQQRQEQQQQQQEQRPAGARGPARDELLVRAVVKVLPWGRVGLWLRPGPAAQGKQVSLLGLWSKCFRPAVQGRQN